MKEYRIGTDIKVRWQVTINNGVVPIEGADLTLQITNCLGQRMTLPHIITDGKVETIVYGKSQKQLGAYALTLWLNLGKVNQTAIDHIDAFRLVASSELIKDKTDSNNLQTGATVDLSGMMLTGIQGESAYEIWLRNGHTGTEADFVAWLKGPQGEPGTPGVPGNGIDHIEKTATEGKFDTYTIYFTDGTTYEYIVKNGEDAIADAYTKEETNELLAGKVDKNNIAQTLGQSITKVMSQKAVSDQLITTGQAYTLVDGKYYDNRFKSVGDIANLTQSVLSGAKCALVDVYPGEELTLTTIGTAYVVAWIFIDADDKIVERCAEGEVHCSNTKITAPEGAVKLIFNSTAIEPNPSVSGSITLKEGINNLDERVTELEQGGGGGHDDVAEDKAINRRNHVYATASHRTVGQPAQTVAVQSSVVHCMSVELEGVKKVNIRTSGLNYNSLPYYFVDKDDILLAIGTESTNLNETIDVPEGAVKLYVNYTYVSYPVANPGVTLYYDYNYYVLNHIKNDKPLAGKKVVMLGDSIHEFTEQGIGIVEHFAELSGATVYRCAVGGAHLTRRSADVGYDVPDVVDALTSEDGLARLEQALTTAYEGKKKYIYDIVASVDIMDVDYVTVLAGTNDWASGNPAVVLGTDDDTTEVNNISGAVRYIIDTLLDKNPKLQIKFFTPIPRAYNADLANFSDTYIPYSGGYLLPDLCKRVMAVCKNSHVPCCDMYWGLGWNKSNLLTYAGGDGVHPYQGFKEMAVHEVAFVVGQDKNPESNGGVDIVQVTGQSTDKVMSQKAVSDLIGNVEQLLASI